MRARAQHCNTLPRFLVSRAPWASLSGSVYAPPQDCSAHRPRTPGEMGWGRGRLLCVVAAFVPLIAQAQPPSPAGAGLQDTLDKVKDVSRRAPLLKTLQADQRARRTSFGKGLQRQVPRRRSRRSQACS